MVDRKGTTSQRGHNGIGSVGDLKNLEQALRESEEKFRSIFEGAGDGILAANAKTKRFAFGNSRICEITGYPLEELLKLDVTKIHPKKDLPYVLDQFTKQVQGKILTAEDIPVLRKDKSVVCCDVSSRVIKIGGQEYLLEFFRDITEHKKAEEALQDAKERWTSLTDNADDTIVIADNKNIIRYINRTIPPTTPEGVIGKSVYNYVSKEHHNVMRKSLKKVYKTGKPDSYEVTLDMSVINPEIGTMWFNTKLVPIKTDKEVSGVIMVASNITERKKAEEALQESEEKFRDLFENASDLIQSVDAEGRFVYVNKEWLRTMDYTQEELEKLKLTDILRKDQIPHCMEIFKRVCKGESLDDVEAVFIAKNGREVYVEGNVNAHIRDGKFIATRAIFRNITGRKKTEEELKKRTEELEKFNKLAVGRELKMIELKKELNKLYEKLGKKPKHNMK